jgi:ankyrin repeat protein
MMRNLDMVRLLIIKGYDASHYNSKGQTPLHVALEPEYHEMPMHLAIVEHLLEFGADPW